MDLTDAQLFRDKGSDFRDVAMLTGTTSRAFPYALGFGEAANRLIDAKTPGERFDLVVFPLLYLYRHAFELTMKDLIYEFERWELRPPEVLRTHKLGVLWGRVRPILLAIWPDGDKAELDAMERIVLDLDGVDPDGEQFRYEVNRDGFVRQLPTELIRVDLVNVRNVCDEVLGRLGGVGDYLAESRYEAGDPR